MFPLPPELVTEILDLAEYWVHSETECRESTRVHNSCERYLQSIPIDGESSHPLRHLVITTDSDDSNGDGRLRQPWTKKSESGPWFELSLDDGETGEEITRVELIKSRSLGFWQFIIDEEEILKQAKKGDRLGVWVRAQSPDWCINVESVKIETWVAC